MLSHEMYDLLKRIPRFPNSTPAGNLYPNNPKYERVRDLLLEAEHYDYINAPKTPILENDVSLTEKGQSAIEEYERAEQSHKMTEESLKVAKAAKVAAIFSAIAAFAALVDQIQDSIIGTAITTFLQSICNQ